MGARNKYTLFAHCTLDQLHEAIAARVAQFGGHTRWDCDDADGIFLGISTNGDAHACSLGYRGGIYGFWKGVGRSLNCPWMELRIVEGNHWEYSLMVGDRDADDFSAFPQPYIHHVSQLWEARGRPPVLADLWGVPRSRIERYLVNWDDSGFLASQKLLPFARIVLRDWLRSLLMRMNPNWYLEPRRTGKAYPSDEFEYGDIWQCHDFMRALRAGPPPEFSPGEVWGSDPDPGGRHRLYFPDPSDIYRYAPRLPDGNIG